ncbi:MAG: heavy-metal-associated domain-containing protein [Bacteroidota bacterium]
MQKQYHIQGMSCGSCVAKVKKSLEALPAVEVAKVQLEAPQGTLQLNQQLPLSALQTVVAPYHIEEVIAPVVTQDSSETTSLAPISIQTYRPLLLIVGFIIGVTLLAQYPFDSFSGMLWMRHFMAGFFLVFAFFKLLNVEGFANSYQMYDLIAGKWKGWGYVYPFVELGLGIAYLINFAPVWTNWITLIVLGISSIGVIKSNLDKRQIKCACLGDVFNLPMSTVTIVEDLSMVAMAAAMLFLL